jgi:diacylglycerol kinase
MPSEKKFTVKARIKSFTYAFRGIVSVIRFQHNFRIHLTIAMAVIIAGLWLGLSNIEWILVVIVIGFVLVTEMINSAIEELTDMVSPEKNIKAGLVKDIAAGAVLVSAISAAITGLLIFIPKILHYL